MRDEYVSQCARDARDRGYGTPSYWRYLDQHSQELAVKLDDPTMLTRSLSEALRGNEGA